MQRARARSWIGIACMAMWLFVAASTTTALADARTEFLVRMLATSAQFRVRAQAALALGGQAPASNIVRALIDALRDEHQAVRAASASALERLKDPSAIPALKAAQSDRDGSVRSAARSAIASLESARPAPIAAATPAPVSPSGAGGSPVFYVGVGVPGSQVGLPPPTLRNLRQHVISQVSQMAGVAVAPENEDRRAAERVIGTRKLVGFYVDSSITSIEQRSDGSVRAQVSVILGTYPGRDMRAMLSGAATVSGGGTGEEAKAQAVQAAFTGALRRLPQAMQVGLSRVP